MDPLFLLLIAVVLAVVFFIMSRARRAARLRRIIEAPFPAEWDRIIKRNIPLYCRLPVPLRDELHIPEQDRVIIPLYLFLLHSLSSSPRPRMLLGIHLYSHQQVF